MRIFQETQSPLEACFYVENFGHLLLCWICIWRRIFAPINRIFAPDVKVLAANSGIGMFRIPDRASRIAVMSRRTRTSRIPVKSRKTMTPRITLKSWKARTSRIVNKDKKDSKADVIKGNFIEEDYPWTKKVRIHYTYSLIFFFFI